jgi:hypothetical protein
MRATCFGLYKPSSGTNKKSTEEKISYKLLRKNVLIFHYILM